MRAMRAGVELNLEPRATASKRRHEATIPSGSSTAETETAHNEVLKSDRVDD